MDWNRITHAQRNWDLTRPIDNEILQTLLNRMQAMPTKQNLPTYDIYYTQDRNFINDIFKATAEVSVLQGQVLAPCVIWFGSKQETILQYLKEYSKPDPSVKRYSLLPETDNNIGRIKQDIGMGIATCLIAANDLGLYTGATQCYDNSRMKSVFEKYIPDSNTIMFSDAMIGVGYPHPDAETHRHSMWIDNDGQARLRTKEDHDVDNGGAFSTTYPNQKRIIRL